MVIAPRPVSYDVKDYDKRIAVMTVRAQAWMTFSFKGWKLV